MSRLKNLAMLLTPALLALALTAFADDKKPDDKKPDVKKPNDKKPDDKKPDEKKPEAGVIVIIDSKGKENKVKTWEIVAGTRRLGWLAPPLPEEKPEEKPGDKDDPNAPKRPVRAAPAPRGPEALVFRDENSTGFVNGILTLIPLDNIRTIDYDNEKQTVTVKVATSKPEDDAALTGTTKFAGTNKLTIEAEVDKGELGIAAVKYLGGVKNGIQGIRFPSPKLAAAPMGRQATVTFMDGKEKKTEKVIGLQALYLTGQGDKASPILLFKKTVKLDVAKVKKLAVADEKAGDWTVSLKDGSDETLNLLEQGELDGKAANLKGLLAKVPAGWKLFPLHCIAEVEFEDAK